MKRTICILCLVLLMLSGCGKYAPENFLGKTSQQIQEEFGQFDCIVWPADADGLYRNTTCGYTIRNPRTGLLGTEPEWLIFICFDEYGVAYDTYEDYRPGG